MSISMWTTSKALGFYTNAQQVMLPFEREWQGGQIRSATAVFIRYVLDALAELEKEERKSKDEETNSKVSHHLNLG